VRAVQRQHSDVTAQLAENGAVHHSRVSAARVDSEHPLLDLALKPIIDVPVTRRDHPVDIALRLVLPCVPDGIVHPAPDAWTNRGRRTAQGEKTGMMGNVGHAWIPLRLVFLVCKR
jgi:hypothetical protein